MVLPVKRRGCCPLLLPGILGSEDFGIEGSCSLKCLEDSGKEEVCSNEGNGLFAYLFFLGEPKRGLLAFCGCTG